MNIEEMKASLNDDGDLIVDIMKNPQSAENYGSMFGQDVEPSGTYVSTREDNEVTKDYWFGIVKFHNPLFIDITDNGVGYKTELSNEYKAKGKTLTRKLLKKGIDGIITYENYKGREYVSEIVIFDRNAINWESKNEGLLSFSDYSNIYLK